MARCKEKKTVDTKNFKWYNNIGDYMGIALIILLIILIGILIYINRSLRVVRLKLRHMQLPQAFDGYKIVLMSDLHDKRMGKELLYQIRTLAPDMVAVAGDMHSIKSTSRAFIDLAADIKKLEIPVFFVEGNHDIEPSHHFEYDMFMRSLAENGVTVLHSGVSVPIMRGGERILVSGQGWFDSELFAFDKSAFNIFLKHDPLDFDQMVWRPQVTLSGHVHGGYIELPGIGAVFAPGNNIPIYQRFQKKYFRPKYYKGVYHENGADLVVSRGLGNSVLPFRFMKPEITYITLKRDV